MAEQGTAARLIEVATAEIGTVEGPKDNETKYGKFTKADFQPWCGSFVNWASLTADGSIMKSPEGTDLSDHSRPSDCSEDHDLSCRTEPVSTISRFLFWPQ